MLLHVAALVLLHLRPLALEPARLWSPESTGTMHGAELLHILVVACSWVGGLQRGGADSAGSAKVQGLAVRCVHVFSVLALPRHRWGTFASQ